MESLVFQANNVGTTIAYDPNPPADETQSCPLKEYLIKFLMMNGKKPLTLDFKTFTTSTGLDYNTGEYIAHPSPKAIKDEKIRSLPGILSNSNFLKDPSKVTKIKLTTPIIAVNNQKGSVSPLSFSGKKKKVKSLTVTPTLPKSQGPKASRALSKKKKQPKSKKTPTEVQVTPPSRLTKDSKESHSVSLGNVPDPQDPDRNKQLAGMGLPSTQLDEGTRKSQLLPEGTNTDLKDSGRNVQPTDKGLPSTFFNEGTVKTTSLPKGPYGDKDSKGFKPPADMEPLTTFVTDKTLTTSTISSKSLSGNRLTEDQWEKHMEKAASYADLKSEIEGFYDAAYKVYNDTEAAFSTYEKILIKFQAQYGEDAKSILSSLKVIQDAVKEDPTLNKKGLTSPVESLQAVTLRSTISSLKQDTSEIKSMMTEIFKAFEGVNFTYAATEEPPSHTKGENDDMETQETEVEKEREKETNKEVPTRPTRAVLISTAKKNTKELGTQLALPPPAPEQTSSQLLGRKRTRMELEHEIRIPALECKMSLPEGVPFVNNMVIKEPKYGIFFIDVFGDECFQR
uniref:UvrB/UvrC motif-containing protein n=1 Tax=Tanacetum cinerariifolium TaxID=118510 RepID=A0A699H0H9_TANCI|nr:UvrB/UvrC motif-containing protein [Tanacetum cinerariifolium]